MKVAVVTRRYPPLIGGAEKVLSYLAPTLAEQGAEVTVVTSSHKSSEPQPASSVPIVHLPTSPLRFVGTSLYMRSLKKWLLSNRPNLIYVSMLKHDAYVAVDVGRRLGVPVVLRPEGAGATGDLAWQKWGRFGSRIGARCKLADAFVSISAAVHSELLASGYPKSKIHDLPNGVPVPDRTWTATSSGIVTFVGRLAAEKNLMTLLRAWPLVLDACPDARLNLIGEGPELSALREVADSTVEFAGFCAEPTKRLRESSLFVLPSREEGMSIALLEAMALGMPIVASAIPGNQRLMTDGVHGHLCDPNDPESMARAIIRSLKNPTEAARMGRSARERVIDSFSIQAVSRQHLDLFERLIHEARAC